MDDRLGTIFDTQRALNEEIIARRGLDGISREKWIQMQTLAMMSEMAELIDEVNFKWWKNPKPVDADNVKDEIVDILHFLVSMCLTSGMDANELYERYLAKNKENIARQNGLSAKKGYCVDEKPAN